MDRVLSAACWIWLEGRDQFPQGRESVLSFRVVEALSDRRAEIQWAPRNFPVPVDVSKIVMAASGSRLKFLPGMINARSCSTHLFQVSGVVTTAREPKVEGHLIVGRGDTDPRKWLFVVGIDPYRVATETGLFPDPVVVEAGFIPTPAAQVRQRRKEILGFDQEGN